MQKDAEACKELHRGFIPAEPHILRGTVQWGTGFRNKRGRRDRAVVEVDPGFAVQDISLYPVSKLIFVRYANIARYFVSHSVSVLEHDARDLFVAET